MALRFWLRVRIVPGLRINLSKSGASLSVGRRGGWYTIGPRGRRATVGLPGSGLFVTQHFPPSSAHHAGRWLVFGIAVLVTLVELGVIVYFVLP
jgi:Protein of unknown function (DUF4236)